jgi:hypothetical protein
MQNIAQKAISNAQGNGVILFEYEGLIEYTKRLKLKFSNARMDEIFGKCLTDLSEEELDKLDPLCIPMFKETSY